MEHADSVCKQEALIMKRSTAVALGLSGVGVIVTIVAGAMTSSDPELRDAIRAMGLLIMLAGAAVFLLAKRLRAEFTERAITFSTAARARETLLNLAIAGGCFLLGAVAIAWGFRWMLRPDMLAYWILAGIAVLGAIALAAGGFGFAFLSLFGGARSRT